jgi:hypothetical protein
MASMTDFERIREEIEKDPNGVGYAAAEGDAERLAALLNAPREVGGTVGSLSAEEVHNALSADSIARLEMASAAYAAAISASAKEAAERAAEGVALRSLLANFGRLELGDGTAGRARLEAAVKAGHVTEAERDGLVAMASTSIVQSPVATWGWAHEVTADEVDRALGKIDDKTWEEMVRARAKAEWFETEPVVIEEVR